METAIIEAGTATVEKYLSSSPDPVAVATDLIPRLIEAIELAKSAPEANDVRTMFDMAIRYLRQQLPGATKDRWEQYDLMYPAEMGYVEAAAKAGVLWDAVEGKAVQGQHLSCAELHMTVIDAGFKGRRDAMRCERAGKLHPEDRRTYYLEMNQDQRHVTLDGAERVWLSLQPGPDIEPPPPDKFRVIYADPPWYYTNPQHTDECWQESPTLGN